MKRRMVIISNTGGRANYLESVRFDRENYIKFFQSGNGGAWEDGEIYAPEPNTLSWAGLDQHINDMSDGRPVDLWVIVFTGHGWADEHDTYLEPHPGTRDDEDIPVEWIRQRMANSRCLLICDSCRYPLVLNEGQDPQQREYSIPEGEDPTYLDSCRRLFARCLVAVPVRSFTVGYACKYGQKADNLPDDTGGLYSDALLRSALGEIEHIKNAMEDEPVISFSYIHSLARNMVIRESRGEQVPVLNHDRAGQVPFCVIP